MRRLIVTFLWRTANKIPNVGWMRLAVSSNGKSPTTGKPNNTRCSNHAIPVNKIAPSSAASPEDRREGNERPSVNRTKIAVKTLYDTYNKADKAHPCGVADERGAKDVPRGT